MISHSMSAARGCLTAIARSLFARRRLQYRLRSLFLFTAVVAVGLAWWLRPYEVESSEVGDWGINVTCRYTMRRTLLGGEEAYGEQLRTYDDGRQIRWKQWSGVPDHDDRTAMHIEYVLADGTLVSKAEWDGPDFEALMTLIKEAIRPSSPWHDVGPPGTVEPFQGNITCTLVPSE